MSELRFDDRVAVVTGAGRGLGRAYALLLAERGARVVVDDPGGSMRGEDPDAGVAAEVVAEIAAAGGTAVACTASVASPEGGRAIVDTALDRFGRLDILIHNAGTVRYGSLTELSYEDFEAVLDVHLRGAFHTVRAAFPVMSAAGYGRVVLTSSIGGIYGNRSVANYAVSKAGMIGLSNVVALEGAEAGVRCNIIVPSALTRMADGIDTSAYPDMRPELVAPAVAYLAHESCCLSGELLVAIAGRVARAYIAETPGVYQPSWTVDEVAARIDDIRNTDNSWILPPLSAHAEHIGRSFAMATEGKQQ
ncbi:NAD(P)-dependent dehydrogenase (short-subunit alcohol dehydrogenase family) [Nocardia kruczakiae]|uniref:NAD(P)-dependent dehydrogenase (Short-subunit alcohol dehydrogenase family) n=1 Tax=Nocardia kruczakiae TaxID=261477 RepID=A0ABU1X7C2_9NOCA|nr:SDR family NAD(P)-dependent oxidoreductase [Nocardia kruczakiae]MDR7166433.1 NAD(P)-dependent dehydrogenase (short-subunit alcohol dehydrogenase family) [Nocardia kruczakiae]